VLVTVLGGGWVEESVYDSYRAEASSRAPVGLLKIKSPGVGRL